MTILELGQPSSVMRNAKVSALLIYLWRNPTPQSRDTLATLLWSETVTAQAKSNLRTLLSRLKRLFDGVEVTRKTVTFRPKTAPLSDLTTLEAAIHNPGQLAETDLALWHGDFLFGFTLTDAFAYNEWVSAERERIRQKLITACQHATTHLSNKGQWAQVAAISQRWRLIDPFEEAAYAGGIEAALHNGNRTNAQRILAECHEHFQTELGISPGKQLQNLLDVPPELTRPQHNLPAPRAPLWGRHLLVEATVKRFVAGERLLTLIGLGGIGKTRLSLAVAQQLVAQFTAGVWFVSLAELAQERSDAATESAIAAHCLKTIGVPAMPQTPPIERLCRHLRDQPVLLVLDNFEHLMGGALIVNQLLDRCPHLAILVTSRERLNLQHEHTVQVRGLPLPQKDGDDAAHFGCVQLFASTANQQARLFRLDASTLDQVVAICQSLDGLPLGIELAASLIEHYQLDEIRGILSARAFDQLTSARRDLPERQRSLNAIFDYSWRLLPTLTQQMLARLSVFRGVFDRRAAEAVAEASVLVLRQLVDKSLLQQVDVGRYEMHRLVHEFASTRLRALGGDEQNDTRVRHYRYFLDLLVEQEPYLNGEQMLLGRQALDAQFSNVRQAWQWAIDDGNVAQLQRSHAALVSYFRLISSPFELIDLLEDAVVGLTALPDAVQLVGGISAELAYTYATTSQYSAALAAADRVLANSAAQPDAIANALWAQGETATRQGELVVGRTKFVCASQLETLSDGTQFRLTLHLGLNLGLSGDDEAGEAEFRRALEIATGAGDKFSEMEALRLIGVSHTYRPETNDAQIYLERALTMYRKYNVLYGEARTLHGLGTLCDARGQYEQAIDYFEQGLALAKRINDDVVTEYILHNLGVTYSRLGVYEQARECFEKRLTWRETQHEPSRLFALLNLGLLHLHLGEVQIALALHQEVLEKAQQFGIATIESTAWQRLGQDWYACGQWENSAEALSRAIALQQVLKRDGWLLESKAALARTLLETGQIAAASSLVEVILPHLQSNNLINVREPMLLWLTCFQVLNTTRDPRTQEVLAAAAENLYAQADRIANADLRTAFLTQQANNRELLAVANSQV